MAKVRKKKAAFLQTYLFDDGTREQIGLEELALQHLEGAARMFMSDEPSISAVGKARLRVIAHELAALANTRLWQSLDNRTNAQQPRESRYSHTDSIEDEFDQLVRAGHSAREARGILLLRGTASQSTIYRRTKARRKK